jgi:hypothetical protein
MGAEIALEMASRDHSAAAIVADGAGLRSARELPDVGGNWNNVMMWPIAGAMTIGTSIVRGEMPPSPMSGKVDEIETPVFYIASANVFDELDLNQLWFQKTTAEKALWEVDAGHTGGLKTHPEEYESRVIAWFDSHLLQQAR